MQFQRRLLPLGTVYLSKSRCVYENLAFEEWLFRKHDFGKSGEALLLWRYDYEYVYSKAKLNFCCQKLKNEVEHFKNESGKQEFLNSCK